MGKYLLRRILQMIPVVLGTTLLVYALVFALPGDPVKAMFGDKPVNEAVAAQIRAEYHLDQPFIVQYFIYLKNALTLNFGDTFAGQPVLDEITRAFPVTIRLGLMAFVFEAIFGVVFGIISGLKKGKWYDTVILIVSLLLISVPTFVTGFVMQYVFGIQWAILPVTAGADPGFLDLLMPAMVLGSVSMAYIIRLTRSEISSNIAEDYVRTARAKGMSNGQVMLRHVLRNSLIPVVTYLGQDIGALMGGAMITEQIFNIHGIGFLTEDRRTDGCALKLDIKTNVNMSSYDMISKAGCLNLRKEKKRAEEFSRSVNVKTPSISQLVGNLSGGNQQKVVIAKLLCRDPEILIFDEPTVGIDVGAKQEIFKLIERLTERGRGVILISSYLPEVMGLSDRLIVMAQGKITAEYDKEALKTLTEADVLRMASIED